MIIKWLLIVLIAVSIILFVGSIFEWFDWLYLLFDYEFNFQPIGTYLVMQYIALLILKIIGIFAECTWIDPATNTIVWSIAVTTALYIIAIILE